MDHAICVKRFADDMALKSKKDGTTEVSQRVGCLLDLIEQLTNTPSSRSMDLKQEVVPNVDMLNCFLMVYYTVPSYLKSNVVASLFSLAEKNPKVSHQNLLTCFMLRELAADHNGDFKLEQVN